MPEPGEITRLLQAWRSGDDAALDTLIPLVYDELRRLAGSYMRNESPSHTLSPTALVHECYLKLVERERPADFQDRRHFFVAAARAMRFLLVDHARRKHARKRDADAGLQDLLAATHLPGTAWDVIDLDRALDRLQQVDPALAKAVELRYFGGLTLDEIATVLAVSAPTVSRELRLAQAWLGSEIRVRAHRAS